MAQLRPFPTDPRLTGIAIAYRNAEMVADRILPRVPVAKKEFRWLKFDRAERMTVPETLVGRKSLPNEVDFTASEEAGLAHDRGLDDVVPNDDINEAPEGLDLIGEATEGLTELILLDREIRVAAKVMNAANYAADNKVTLTGTDQFDDPAATPLKFINDALETLIVRPNVLLMPVPVWNVLRAHPNVVSAITPSGTGNGMVTRQQLAALLEVDEIIVGQGWKNSAKPGQDATIVRVWGGDSMLAFYRNPQATPRRGVTFGYTAQVGGRVSGQIAEPKMGLRGSVRVRVGETVGEILVATDVALLFQDVLST
jgi:hypothetical protein